MPVDRRHEIEILRRSIAMLSPGAMALSRERAGELLDRLHELERLVDDLRRLLDEVEDER